MKKAFAILFTLSFLAWGCEKNDLGRYCVVGQQVTYQAPEGYGQPSVTVLNIEAPECNKRLCLQQGPFKLHPEYSNSTSPRSCAEDWCTPPYRCTEFQVGTDTVLRCVYKVRPVCTKECSKHKDCKSGGENANDPECSAYVCHKQAEGESWAGHCICVCKDFLIDPNPNIDPPRFYAPEAVVPEPEGCL